MMAGLRDRPLLPPAVLLWGWQMDWLWLALGLAVALELPRWVSFRIEISQRDFERLWSFTGILFLGVIVYLALANRGVGGGIFDSAPAAAGAGVGDSDGYADLRSSPTALAMLRWGPLVLFPFVAAHAWSRVATLPWRTFSLYEQARAKRKPLAPPPGWAMQPMRPGVAFAAVMLFSAASCPDSGPWFMPTWACVLLLMLWPWRNPGHRAVLVAPACLVILVIAWAAQDSHRVAQRAWDMLEERLYLGGVPDLPGASAGEIQRTDLGVVGRLHQSDAIMLRGDYPAGQPPGLLGEAVFDRFSGRSWTANVSTYHALPVTVAPLDPALVTITRPALSGHTPLVLPLGARALQSPAAMNAESTAEGAARTVDAPFLVMYQVRPGGTAMAAPGVDDLSLHHLGDQDRRAIATVIAAIGATPTATLPDRIITWLGAHCSYSLDPAPPGPADTPLAYFLMVGHQGHCEFFATAAVLLLRAGGVPARYVVGFVPEPGGDGTWIARGRDAHAWCLAWQGGQWREVDATPGGWSNDPAERAPWWRPVADAWSWATYRFNRWRALGGRWRAVVFVVGMVILIWIALRQLRGSRWLRAAPAVALPFPGADSELLPVVARLYAAGRPRAPGQTLRAWGAGLGPAWDEALGLHERLRFDPAGLDPGERERLRRLALEIPLTMSR